MVFSFAKFQLQFYISGRKRRWSGAAMGDWVWTFVFGFMMALGTLFSVLSFRLRSTKKKLLHVADQELLNDAKLIYPKNLDKQIDFIQRHGGIANYENYAQQLRYKKLITGSLLLFLLVGTVRLVLKIKSP